MTEADQQNPEQKRRILMRWFVANLLATIAWLLAMFLTRSPAIDYFCICMFIPLILASGWFIIGWHLLILIRQNAKPHRNRLIAGMLLAFLLVPYIPLRAGSDMFTISLRYVLWRAGGAESVREAFNRWVAKQPIWDGADEKLLFARLIPRSRDSGEIVPLPLDQLPPEVRFIHKMFPSRFGHARKDVADLDNVSALTTTDILIGPPSWQPEGGETSWYNDITGSRRKIADGIWVEFGTYDK